MPNRLRLNLFFFLIAWLTSFYIFSQDTEKLALTSVLSQIEAQFEVKFSYEDATVKDIYISPIQDFKSLEEIIRYLNSATPLDFKILNNRFITIRKKVSLEVICGFIKDIHTNAPLNGATVEISENLNTVTDEKGYFELKDVSFDASMKIKFLGYRTMNLPAQRLLEINRCRTIFIQSNREQLDEVVLVNYLTKGINKEVDGAINVELEEFGILPGLSTPDVLQTIQALPGVESIDETITNINIRGGTHDQNFILWDGIKMYQAGHFFGLISAFNPYLIESVDVIKNGTSAKFNDGVSSTINIKTKDEVARKISGGAGFNFISSDIYGAIPLNKNLSLEVSGRRSVTDFLTTPTFERFFERTFQDTEITEFGSNVDSEITGNEVFLFYDYSAKILLDIGEKDEFRASFINITNEVSYDEFGNSINETQTSTLDQQNIGAGAKWKREWNTKVTSLVSAYYTQFNIDAVNFDITSNQRLEQNNEVLEWGIKAQATIKFNDVFSLESGYQLYEVGITNAVDVSLPRFFQITKDVLLNQAVYTEASWSGNNIYIRAGVRANYPEAFNRFIIEPRLNVNHKITNAFALNFQGEFKSQYTTQIIDLQEDFLGVDNRRWVLANEEDIPITTSRQATLGFDYNHKGWLISSSIFYKDVDGITTQSQGFLDQNQFVIEAGSFDVQGAELLINKRNERYSAWLSYTYGENNYTFENLTPQSFPNNADIRHSLVVAGTYTFNKLKLALGVNWRSGRPFTLPDQENPINNNVVPAVINYQDPNAVNLDDFLRVDVSASYNFKLGNAVNATLSASVLNALNSQNTIISYFRLSDAENRIQQVDSRSLGITPDFSFRIQF